MTNELIEQIHQLRLLIERIPACPEQTAASVAASALHAKAKDAKKFFALSGMSIDDAKELLQAMSEAESVPFVSIYSVSDECRAELTQEEIDAHAAMIERIADERRASTQ